MGFWIMMISLILGLGLLVFGFSPTEKASPFNGDLSKISAVTGFVLIGFAIYLAWPK